MNWREFSRSYFELLYLLGDPWQYEISENERNKYNQILACLADERPRRALETGCSIGVFTELLAPRVEIPGGAGLFIGWQSDERKNDAAAIKT